jgi:hypothetical protein
VKLGEAVAALFEVTAQALICLALQSHGSLLLGEIDGESQ